MTSPTDTTKNPEQYFWQTDYEGKLVREDNKDGIKFKDIMSWHSDDKPFFLTIITSDGNAIITLLFGDGRKPIFFRRRMNHLSPLGSFTWTITCTGWEEKIKGKVSKSMAYIYPNGKIEFSNGEPGMAVAYHNKLISLLEEKHGKSDI